MLFRKLDGIGYYRIITTGFMNFLIFFVCLLNMEIRWAAKDVLHCLRIWGQSRASDSWLFYSSVSLYNRISHCH